MTLLDNDHFLVELAKLFQKCRTSNQHNITITLKHFCSFNHLSYYYIFSDDGRTKPYPRNEAQQSLKGEDLCLFRVKLGDKKISTVVHAKEVNKFQLAYAGILKANMDNLKKRERKTAVETKIKSISASKNAVKI
uniref:Signal recognition particle 14 kDa protein n=1 Tax=Elaeophora elaphi TaxID=1147741 RepID=A0A0R3S1E3_9BILA